MKLIDAIVEWYLDCANTPELRLIVDTLPSVEELVYTQHGSIYLAVHPDGFVSYYSYREPGNGFGGASFELTMDDGTKKTLKGPWSSRAGVVNLVQGQQVVDVKFRTADGGNYWGAVTLELAEKAAAMAGVTLELEHKFDDDEPYWVIANPKPYPHKECAEQTSCRSCELGGCEHSPLPVTG